ncbi:UDP-N-acetylglucosamine 2-epimerase (hydrolyzing) [Caproiciproducens sp. NJN-50]|uniref:UDP-N-acetylglucosamine 2-epimerase n=1 Tax=Caproiciproducens sp. NJN-50 TaxID=2507162 RepID=UPI000FFE0A4B|nr:UDP-N-acetylglucosamine 2-epimerase [Caproiciproducens sp. NJN-50]QAT48884.1 UDP-N-acetylglucosamine 2-epimerase (hydrolyzing) [Caproiciproducens sp. NJN-50]
MKRKLCAVTGTRSEYGLLVPLLKAVEREPDFTLQLTATGAHLSPEFGLTYREIEQDGFQIDRKIETLLSSDTPVGIAKSIGLGVIGFAEAFDQLRPDLLLLLGDRYEILAAAQAALVMKIPIAHIGGGDTTLGAFDEAIRHSVTKMAHLHFVTNGESARRVRQLGENPRHIYNVGSLGIDRILSLPHLSREELERSLGFSFRSRNLLVTFHPVTLDREPSGKQFQELLAALDALGEEYGLIFTGPNADPQSRELTRLTREFAAEHPNAAVFSSLGQTRYFSLIRETDAVVGNSSSGIYEAPSFRKPAVNVGDRQQGRLFASSVISCAPQKTEILKAIRRALETDCSKAVNPYGAGDSAEKILSVLKSIPDYRALLKKQFDPIRSDDK